MDPVDPLASKAPPPPPAPSRAYRRGRKGGGQGTAKVDPGLVRVPAQRQGPPAALAAAEAADKAAAEHKPHRDGRLAPMAGPVEEVYGRPDVRRADAARVVELEQQIWLLRVEGVSRAEICDRLNLTPKVFDQIIARVLAYKREVNKANAEEMFQLTAARLESLHSVMWPRAVGGVITDPHTGAPVIDERTGKPCRYDVDYRAVDRLLSIYDRSAKLHGLDVNRIELTGANGGPLSIENVNLSRLSPTEIAVAEHLLRKAAGADVIDGEIVDPPADAYAEGEGEPDPEG